MSVSALEWVVIISGIKYYLNQNSFELSQATLEILNIQGITENELIAAPNFRGGYHQTDSSPQCLSIEHAIIQAILSHKRILSDGFNTSDYLSTRLSGKGFLSKEGAKLLGRLVLQEPNLILRIVHYHSTTADNIFKVITKDHIVQSLNQNPELIKDYIFKVLNIKNL